MLWRSSQAAFAPFGAYRCARKVVFLHIPKAAGSNVHAYFNRRLGHRWMGQAVLLSEVSSPSRRAIAHKARYVGGHFGARMMAELAADAFRFTILRDPVERVVSAWRFSQTHRNPRLRLPFDSLEAALASGDPDVVQSFDNVIARQLAVAFSRFTAAEVARDEWTGLALDTLGSLDFVGDSATFAQDFAKVLTGLGLPPDRSAAGANRTDDPSRRNRDPGLQMPQLPPPDRLTEITGPYVDLDRAVCDAWAAKIGV